MSFRPIMRALPRIAPALRAPMRIPPMPVRAPVRSFATAGKPFRVLAVQQIAVGGTDKVRPPATAL